MIKVIKGKEQRHREGCGAVQLLLDHLKPISLPSLKHEPGTLGFMISDEKGGVKSPG